MHAGDRLSSMYHLEESSPGIPEREVVWALIQYQVGPRFSTNSSKGTCAKLCSPREATWDKADSKFESSALRPM
jgi:hypothetical protein